MKNDCATGTSASRLSVVTLSATALLLGACAKPEAPPPSKVEVSEAAEPWLNPMDSANEVGVPELEEDVRPDILQTKPIDEPEGVIEQPVLEDAKIDDHNETDGDTETEESLGDPRFNSDKPFQGQGTNADIGVGGGAGGFFGGRSRRQAGGRITIRGRQSGRMVRPAPKLSRVGPGQEEYASFAESGFIETLTRPLSTFSTDVDTASWSIVRSFLEKGQLPTEGALRVEEIINAFRYDDPAPTGEDPLAFTAEVADCPWNQGHRLVRIALRARDVKPEARPAANLVLLLDVSGSMQDSNKLPLLKSAMTLLVDRLRSEDRISIVTFADEPQVALETTSGEHKQRILRVIDGLGADGSTYGQAGLKRAYEIARAAFVKGGINRVIVGTDGDFNVGETDADPLVAMIRKDAGEGIFLSVLGLGNGNYKDARLEKLADEGNGNYAYLDSLREARRVLVERLGGTLQTVAKDVKVQVEFNPGRVRGYRLVGYENRRLADKDFNDDRKDAGDIGAGHSVTALYEVLPVAHRSRAGVDNLRYKKEHEELQGPKLPESANDELLQVKIRWKQPTGTESTKRSLVLRDESRSFGEASESFRWSSSVAAFALVLRASEHRGGATFDSVLQWARAARGENADDQRHEFMDLVRRARSLVQRESARR